MKNFKICNNDLSNWFETTVVNAIDVVRCIENHNLSTYEIEWKTPLTGEYATIIEVEDGKRVFTTEHFIVPKTFSKLGK